LLNVIRETLLVIAEPAPGTPGMLVTNNTDPSFVYFEGPARTEQACGNCDRTLIRGAEPGQVTGVKMQCPGCGEWYDTGHGGLN
jgi:hypothetical protein